MFIRKNKSRSYHYETLLGAMELFAEGAAGSDAKKISLQTLLKMGLDEQAFRAGRKINDDAARSDLRLYLQAEDPHLLGS